MSSAEENSALILRRTPKQRKRLKRKGTQFATPNLPCLNEFHHLVSIFSGLYSENQGKKESSQDKKAERKSKC